MSSARLTALRLVGFKSFAERTTVEFGPGISAIVGPNGSGKSNLADALRWTLGEQGRTLRTRRAEDVIFAGSSSRRAVGMADVTLVVDNHDRLLPVDFGEVEIGRRLYRSGENEYLLNRQKIRLRDLVELLDAGNLADNAFLFIGQGMVDQALALRPEERRPLFEEAAGVRRHERRRRRAEAELADAETNLERLRDVLAELRPQARRLAAQAEQLQARRTAGAELAEALLDTARARWVTAARNALREHDELDRARAAADAALAELEQAEQLAASLTERIGRRAEAENGQREVLEEQRSRITELRVSHARLESELAALARDEQRLRDERALAERRMHGARAQLDSPRPLLDDALAGELEAIERQLVDAEDVDRAGDVAGMRDQAARQLAGLRSDLRGHERRRDQLRAQVDDAAQRLTRLDAVHAAAAAEQQAASDALRAAAAAEQEAVAALDAARAEVERATAERAAAHERQSVAEAELGAARVALAALEAELDANAEDGLARAARARGAPLLAEGLEVDPRFRLAVAAALGDATSAFIIEEQAATAFAGRRGTLVVRASGRRASAGREAAQIIDAAVGLGGGGLGDAIRRDPQGAVTDLVERTVWLPDLAAALAVRGSLAPGWLAVTLDGTAVSDQGIVRLGQAQPIVDRRRERDEGAAEVAVLEQRAESERKLLRGSAEGLANALATLRTAQDAHAAARGAQRRAEEAERVGQRRAEHALREQAWERAQAGRLGTDIESAEAAIGGLEEEVARLEREVEAESPSTAAGAARKRAADLRQRAAVLRRARDAQQAAARAADDARRTAEVRMALDEARLRELDDEGQRLVGRRVELDQRRAEISALLTAAEARHVELKAALDALLREGADDRTSLLAAEHAAVAARDRLRAAETSSRQAEVRALEARLLLDQTREQLLVELAGIGDDGLTALREAATGAGAQFDEARVDDGSSAEAMDQLLNRAIERWQSAGTDGPAPSSARLAGLRRRFHDLGAGNPFAVEEYAELRARLEASESQRSDMEAAITATRALIASLGQLINEQFRTTFAALEDAFARRFHELFGGGEAQLSLTAPDDLSATGVEIHARPPGKKRQPLSMLSGGERALTAVSLLLAMLEVRPVPFCVLDEVDAALDEANIGRFSRALRGLAEQTQFIVITHNRGTIEGADALYGVTIGDDAVSRVVSLRLPGSTAGLDADARLLTEATAR